MMLILTKEDGLKTFQELDRIASQSFCLSKENLCMAIVSLNEIREKALFTFGGYADWDSYLEDFRSQNGISRGLVYENLKVVRLARKANLGVDDIVAIGLDTIKPYFETGGPIESYNRRTGQIKEIAAEILPLLPDGDSLGDRFGQYVRENVASGDPPSMVRRRIKDTMKRLEISFMGVFADNRLTGLTWQKSEGDEYEEGAISFDTSLPREVEDAMLRMLRVPMEWRE